MNEIHYEFTTDDEGRPTVLRDGKPIVDKAEDLKAIDRRLHVANALRQEIERLHDDVLDIDRNQKINFLLAWLARERDALNEYGVLMNILREGEAP